jgi:hypothetical protein
LQRLAEIFCRDIAAFIPIVFKSASFLCEDVGQPLHDGGYKFVSLANRRPWIVYKAGLYVLPAMPKVPELSVGEKRSPFLGRRCVTSGLNLAVLHFPGIYASRNVGRAERFLHGRCGVTAAQLWCTIFNHLLTSSRTRRSRSSSNRAR